VIAQQAGSHLEGTLRPELPGRALGSQNGPPPAVPNERLEVVLHEACMVKLTDLGLRIDEHLSKVATDVGNLSVIASRFSKSFEQSSPHAGRADGPLKALCKSPSATFEL